MHASGGEAGRERQHGDHRAVMVEGLLRVAHRVPALLCHRVGYVTRLFYPIRLEQFTVLQRVGGSRGAGCARLANRTLLALTLSALAGCGSANSGGDVSAHDQSTLRTMEHQIAPRLEKQLRKFTQQPVAVEKVDCADTGEKTARCIARDSEGGRYGIDVNVSSDGSFLWEVRP